MKNLDIFVCSFSDFSCPVKNPSYRVVDSRLLNKIYKINNCFDDKDVGEIYHICFVKNFVDLKDYVGICHYRRFFDFMDNIPDLDSLFQTHDIILLSPEIYRPTTKSQYAGCHNIEDIDIAEQIIKNKFPDYYDSFIKFFNQQKFFPCNMFIMRKEDFINYVEFIESFIKEWANVVGTNMRQRVIDNKKKYGDVEYQSRLLGFVLERLTNVYIFNHFKNEKCFNMAKF